ncbi:hypothetical protein O181_007167 [Austropuccinia psidii MF-1]|uniref:Uncharacterized protein n=1 Tax=Austropuccinia psidii MF-1 TaxID=1389203 RepID=A0A9Q3BLE4_9BASI|nr:hypothetical protein [Austropuccinia psidii MF-1]
MKSQKELSACSQYLPVWIFTTDVITDPHHCCGLVNSPVYISVSTSLNSYFRSVPLFTSTIHSNLLPLQSLRPDNNEPRIRIKTHLLTTGDTRGQWRLYLFVKELYHYCVQEIDLYYNKVKTEVVRS